LPVSCDGAAWSSSRDGAGDGDGNERTATEPINALPITAGAIRAYFARLHGRFNFVGQPLEVFMQPVEHLLLAPLGRQVTD